jgi:hypothetical protein
VRLRWTCFAQDRQRRLRYADQRMSDARLRDAADPDARAAPLIRQQVPARTGISGAGVLREARTPWPAWRISSSGPDPTQAPPRSDSALTIPPHAHPERFPPQTGLAERRFGESIGHSPTMSMVCDATRLVSMAAFASRAGRVNHALTGGRIARADSPAAASHVTSGRVREKRGDGADQRQTADADIGGQELLAREVVPRATRARFRC